MLPHIGHFLYHYPQPGGTTTAVGGLSRSLVRLGHKVSVYCCSGCVAPHHLQTKAGDFAVYEFAGSQRNPFEVSESLRDRLRRNVDGVDLLVIHGIFNPRNVAMAKAATKAGLPYVVCPHGVYHPELLRKNRLRKYLYGRFWERPLLNAACAVQAFSEYHVKFLRDYGVRVPIILIPNGFDPAQTPEAGLAGRDFGDGRVPRLLYLGRLDMHTKGLDLLLEAISLGIQTGRLPSTLRLDLVGPDWGDRARLLELVKRLRLSESVAIFGPVGERQKWSMITGCDLLVLTSRHDAFPTSVLEAMIAARPVLISEHTGISPMVRSAGCGFLVQPKRESICAGLVTALESREQWLAIGENGRAFAYQHLQWDTVAQRASECYQALLNEGATVPAMTFTHTACS